MTRTSRCVTRSAGPPSSRLMTMSQRPHGPHRSALGSPGRREHSAASRPTCQRTSRPTSSSTSTPNSTATTAGTTLTPFPLPDLPPANKALDQPWPWPPDAMNRRSRRAAPISATPSNCPAIPMASWPTAWPATPVSTRPASIPSRWTSPRPGSPPAPPSSAAPAGPTAPTASSSIRRSCWPSSPATWWRASRQPSRTSPSRPGPARRNWS